MIARHFLKILKIFPKFDLEHEKKFKKSYQPRDFYFFLIFEKKRFNKKPKCWKTLSRAKISYNQLNLEKDLWRHVSVSKVWNPKVKNLFKKWIP